jgi:hypothetical protein
MKERAIDFGASGRGARPNAGSFPTNRWCVPQSKAACIVAKRDRLASPDERDSFCAGRSARLSAAAAACAADRYRKLCRQSSAQASVAVGPPDAFVVCGWPRASSPRAGLPPGMMQNKGGLPEEDRAFNSLRNARQIFSQTPCSSQSRSRRQQVEGRGYFSGKSCHRAPLRKVHRIPDTRQTGQMVG